MYILKDLTYDYVTIGFEKSFDLGSFGYIKMIDGYEYLNNEGSLDWGVHVIFEVVKVL